MSPRLSFVNHDTPAGLAWDEVTLPAAPFKTAVLRVDPGHTTPVDSHAVHEIWLVVRGTGELTYDGSPLRLSKDDAVYLEPPKTHEVHNDGTEPLVVHSIWWEPTA
ncbi:cupin domain-containing protein [Allokutzneria sp. A3M-2-11 16]|uniref:cupin domain-containing protein n=1 Tax=Allokutzneria sp. A3M-2-11 16 TaxID=2962043 RepID=UPI0020B761C9|nr:cupin domain-containing protein [Allokutzneria sp. A3M-2-11 16]MCP3804351.1 cupin domain-containing protein [Allokutzneria sp. A3M-2-11 16]